MKCVKCQSLKLQKQNYYLKSVMWRVNKRSYYECTLKKKKRQEERDEREKNEAGDRSTLPLPMVSNSSWVLVDTNSKIPIGGQLREELWPCLDKK